MSEPIAEGVVHNADNDLKRIANFARGVIALEDEVSKLGGLTQACAETTARLEQLRAQEGELLRLRSDAQAEADRLVAEAQQTAATIVAGNAALEETRASLDATIAERQGTLAGLDAAAAEKQAQHDELDAAVGRLRGEQDQIASQVTALEQRHAELAAAIEEQLGAHELARSEHEEFLRRVGAKH